MGRTKLIGLKADFAVSLKLPPGIERKQRANPYLRRHILQEERTMKYVVIANLALFAVVVHFDQAVLSADASQASSSVSPEAVKEFKVYPIGYVRKAEGRTTIVIDKKYQPALHRLDQLSQIWVLWWFDRIDTPEGRSVLQVHPQGNPDKPLTGVFATHSPRRPNLIAMTRCTIIAVKENVIEIEDIDAFPDTPVLDIKS